ncbi:MAG: OsmC family protein [Porticoccus sp.]
MKAKISWDGEARFLAETESHHTVLMDGPPEHGGKNSGPRPMETMLIAIGGCAAFDVVHILKKGRQSIVSCDAQVEAVRSDEVPAVFTKIHLHFKVSGDNIKENIVRNAVKLSAEKYCSASIMLSKGGVEITHSLELT